MEFRIRRASTGDARSIARVHVDSWRSTYAGIVPDGVLTALSVDDRAKMWDKMLAAEDALMFVAEDETGVFGFACGGRLREALGSYDAELYAIYLLRESQGKGAGRSLFQVLVTALQKAGYSSMALWVLKDNSAVRFYQHMRGKGIASKQIEMGGAQLEEIAFGWPRLDVVIQKETATNV
jgi:L-amino acid N-acyltransferase YncA